MQHSIVLIIFSAIFYAGCTGGGPAPDTTAPVLDQPSDIGSTFNTEPVFRFNSSEAGSLSVAGACSSSTTRVDVGFNTIQLRTLDIGVYNDCRVSVTDAAGNASNPLFIPRFEIAYRTETQDVSFADAQLQQCYNETVSANAWQYIDQVDALDCSHRAIQNLDGLDGLTQLKHLNLAHNKLVQLFLGSGVTQLESLDLSYNALSSGLVPNSGLQAFLAQNPKLKHLNISGLMTDDLRFLPIPVLMPDTNDIGQLQGLSTLIADNLQSTRLVDFSSLSQFVTLEQLSLAGNYIDDERIEFLSNLTNLSRLNLANNQIEALDLYSQTQLVQLNVNNNFLHSVFFPGTLLDPNSNLIALQMANNSLLSLDSVKTLIANNPALEVLDISNFDIKGDALEDFLPSGVLEGGLPVSKLRTFKANHIYALNKDLNALYLYRTSLQNLAISGWGVSDIGSLNQFTQLNRLDLSHNALTQISSLSHLAGQLIELNVAANTQIDKTELKALVGQAVNLEHINISDIRFTRDDFPYPPFQEGSALRGLIANNTLSNMADNVVNNLSIYPRLQHLELANNDLYNMPYIASLEHLNLANNRLESLPDYLVNQHRFKALNVSGNSTFKADDLQAIIQNGDALSELKIDDINLNGEPLELPFEAYFRLKILSANRVNADVQGVLNLLALEELSLAGNNLNHFYSPHRFNKLKKLNLANNNLMNLPQELLQLSNLQELDLSGNHNLQADVINEMIKSNQHLSSLSISHIDFSQVDSSFIEGLLGFNLKHLYAADTNIDTERVSNLINLETLDLSGNDLSTGLYAPFESKLKALYLANTGLTDIDALLNLDDLQVLNVAHNAAINRTQLSNLITQQSDLVTLDISGILFAPRQVPFPTGGNTIESLRVLRADNTQEQLEVYDYPYYPNLTVLSLANNGISYTPPFGSFPNLVELNLRGNELFSLDGLDQFNRLEQLDIADNTNLNCASIEALVISNIELFVSRPAHCL